MHSQVSALEAQLEAEETSLEANLQRAAEEAAPSVEASKRETRALVKLARARGELAGLQAALDAPAGGESGEDRRSTDEIATRAKHDMALAAAEVPSHDVA